MKSFAILALLLIASINCASLTSALRGHKETVAQIAKQQEHTKGGSVVISKYQAAALLYHYNVVGGVPVKHFDACAKVLKAAAAADGVFSEREEVTFNALFHVAGAPDALLEKFESYHVQDIDFEHELKQMQGEDDHLARTHLVFATLAICSSDGFADAELAQARRVAEALRINDEEFNGLLAGVLAENTGKALRFRYMGNQHF